MDEGIDRQIVRQTDRQTDIYIYTVSIHKFRQVKFSSIHFT